DGGAGNDTLAGGTGNDIYVVDSASDVINEAVNAGTDEIRTALATYSIAALVNVENLTYTGSASFTGTGNALANT
ncbi:protease, partial [Rhizobium johnstonii]